MTRNRITDPDIAQQKEVARRVTVARRSALQALAEADKIMIEDREILRKLAK